MENYEQKYKEIVERVKELHAAGNFLTKKQMEIILPELTESEDEKVRKDLIKYLKSCRDSLPCEDVSFYDSSISWLEKQKEQKSISAEGVLVRAGLKPYKDGNQWCILAGDNIQEGVCGFGDTIEDALYEFLKEVLDLQKKQKPVECIKFNNEFENQISHLIASVLNGEHEYNEGFVKYVAQSLLGYARKEQKPAEWSEEDELTIADLINYFEGDALECSTEEMVQRIKSLRPQPKQEWSSELTIKDLKKLERLYLEVDEMGFAGESDVFYKEVLKRFKKYKYGNAKEDTDINDTEG